ncbi:MAG: CvpA family protein [Rhizobiales bacterium]|nr:CvpA family protein [Hyphomicrobiales bacterium]
MSNAVILDLLFIVFLLLFSLIGFWRGVVKEGMAAGGILFGALLADSWSPRLGSVVANLLNITQNASRFLAIESLIVSFALIVGYGSGSLLVPPVRGIGRRLGGAVLGAINGALLLAFSLRAAHDEVSRASTQRLLDDSRLAWLLINRFNWFLLAVAGIVVALLFGRLVTEREASSVAQRPARSSDRRPARLPAPSEAGKLEPFARGFDPATERFAADAPSFGTLAPMPTDRSGASIDRPRPMTIRDDEERPDEWRVIRFSTDSTAPIPTPEMRRCPECGAELSDDDVFCPGCGHSLKTAEEKHDLDS